MIVCEGCGRHHLPTAETCPHCAQKGTPVKRLTRGAALLGLALVGGCSGANDKAVALYGIEAIDTSEDTGEDDTGEAGDED